MLFYCALEGCIELHVGLGALRLVAPHGVLLLVGGHLVHQVVDDDLLVTFVAQGHLVLYDDVIHT